MAKSSRFQTLLSHLDAFVPAETRAALVQQAVAFASARPFLSSYLALVALFSLLPLLGLVVFLVILLGILLFWVGVALFILSGFLLFSTALATGAWCYVFSLVLAAQWVLGLFQTQPQTPTQTLLKRQHKTISPQSEPEEIPMVKSNGNGRSVGRPKGSSRVAVVPATEGADGGLGGLGEVEVEKMKRDIARSLK